MPELEYDVTKPYLDLISQYRPKPDEVDPETQRRIAKGNAVAEALRILVDAVGGSKGSNIQERTAPANAVLGAVDKYWKAREANKAEQQRWDQAEMGAGLKAIETESQQRYASQRQKESQDFTAGQQQSQQEFTAAENEKNRLANKTKLSQDAQQFRDELGLKKDIAETGAQIDREKIAASLEKQQMMYPYGRDKGMYISDPDIMKQINIPDNKKSQVLAFLGQDPNVKDEIPIIKMQYGNIGPDAQSDLLISRLYPALSAETRQKIREFIGNTDGTTTTGTQKQGDQFIFYKNSPTSSQLASNTNIQAIPVTNDMMLMDLSNDKYYNYKGFVYKGKDLAEMAWNSTHTNEVGGQSANLVKAIETTLTDAGQQSRGIPQAPTIKKDKNSTLVQVQNTEQQNTISPEQINYMQNIIKANNVTPEIKRAAVYKYLLEQGFDESSSKNAAEKVYQSLIGK